MPVKKMWVCICENLYSDWCSFSCPPDVRACAVAGFPLGAGTLLAKVFEVESLFLAGADEVDMVMNIGAFKDRDYSTVLDELRSAVRIARWIRPVRLSLSCILPSILR